MRRFDSRLLSIVVGVGVCLFSFAAPSKPAKPPKKPAVDFNRDVRPIFAQHCWVCHGADKAALARTGNMKLDTFEGATADRGGHRAITPGKPAASVLLERVTAKDADSIMPPKASGIKPLTAQEIEIIREWISDGAEYKAHWAFIAPKMPKLPTVSNPKWVEERHRPLYPRQSG